MDIVHALLYMFALGSVAHIVGQAIPREWIREERFPFRPFRWEKNGRVYETIRIRFWKQKLPDMSRIMKDMIPKRVSRDDGSEQVDRLVKETCVAEIIHVLLILVSPTIYRFCKTAAGIVLSVVFAVGNVPYILIQRYNRPKMAALSRRLKQRQEE